MLDLDRPGHTLLDSLLDMPFADIGKAHILFSPDVELLLVHDSLYRLDCSDRVDELVPIPMPSLFSDPELQMGHMSRGPYLSCLFSPSHDYVAVASGDLFHRDRPLILHVYRIADAGQIANLDISIGHLEILIGSKIARIKLDFHPSQPKLGVACWVEAVTHEWHIQFLILDLQSMDLEHIQPSLHEKIPLVGRSAIIASQIHKTF